MLCHRESVVTFLHNKILKNLNYDKIHVCMCMCALFEKISFKILSLLHFVMLSLSAAFLFASVKHDYLIRLSDATIALSIKDAYFGP